MWTALQKVIAAARHDTAIYCGHEYTAGNGRFALSSSPRTKRWPSAHGAKSRRCARKTSPTVPTNLALEKETNPFLRVDLPGIRARLGLERVPDWEVFVSAFAISRIRPEDGAESRGPAVWHAAIMPTAALAQQVNRNRTIVPRPSTAIEVGARGRKAFLARDNSLLPRLCERSSC